VVNGRPGNPWMGVVAGAEARRCPLPKQATKAEPQAGAKTGSDHPVLP
jgi:hypothetical protein